MYVMSERELSFDGCFFTKDTIIFWDSHSKYFHFPSALFLGRFKTQLWYVYSVLFAKKVTPKTMTWLLIIKFIISKTDQKGQAAVKMLTYPLFLGHAAHVSTHDFCAISFQPDWAAFVINKPLVDLETPS